MKSQYPLVRDRKVWKIILYCAESDDDEAILDQENFLSV